MNSASAVPVVNTFAEAFPMAATRLIVTAIDGHWRDIAASVFTGYATSVIGCDLEAGLEQRLDPSETPDGRPGVALLAFAFSRDKLEKAVVNRVSQCLLTCPTTAIYDGLPEAAPEKRIALGSKLRFFGDSFQISKVIGDRRYWRVPVMDGEFFCIDDLGTAKGVGGGNLIFGGRSQQATLAAAMRAVEAIRRVPNVILPFPGGIVRSGSKVGSRYRGLMASTNLDFCPTVAASLVHEGNGGSEMPLLAGTEAVYELVIDGLSADDVAAAMRVGLNILRNDPELTVITAGNYGGKLGPFQFPLEQLLDESSDH